VRIPALAAAWAALLPQLASAQPAEPAADAAAAVPRVPYRSVFDGMPRGVESAREDWKKANAEVGRFPRGHIDLLKWEEAQERRTPQPAGSGATEPPVPGGGKERP
jgi:hypothetical protein